MAVDATTAAAPVSAPNANYTATSSSSSTSSGIADNFQTFLTLLTTQLQNQSPLDPLDTNQFTQQLVQFAGVEQQLKTNESLSSLLKLQSISQTTQAMNFVGTTAVVDGSKSHFDGKTAGWTLSTEKPVTAQVSVQSATGQTVYSGKFTLNAGANQGFTWDGRGNDGTQWPTGDYTLSVVATDAAGQNATVSTQIQGVINAVDLSQSTPMLSIGSQTFTLDQIKRVVKAGSTGTAI